MAWLSGSKRYRDEEPASSSWAASSGAGVAHGGLSHSSAAVPPSKASGQPGGTKQLVKPWDKVHGVYDFQELLSEWG